MTATGVGRLGSGLMTTISTAMRRGPAFAALAPQAAAIPPRRRSGGSWKAVLLFVMTGVTLACGKSSPVATQSTPAVPGLSTGR